MPHPSGSIVVVDDDEEMRQALSRLLAAAGFRATTYASAEAFLDAGAIADADCLVLDVQLPGLSGLELCHVLQARGVQKPVVFITAYDDVESRSSAGEAGALAYLSKPFPGKSLLTVLAKAMAMS